MGMGMGMGMGGVGFGQDGAPPPPPVWMRRDNSASDRGGFGNVAPINTDDDDYGRPVQGPYSSAFGGGPSTFGTREYVPAPPPPPPGMNGGDGVWGRFNGSSPAGPTSSGSGPAPSSRQYSTSPPSDVGTSISARMTQTTSSSGSESGGGRSGSSGPIELDMNDSQTLDIYSRVVVFKDDFLREEFSFARSLSANQRKIVHLVAKKLGLGHRSVGMGEDRHVVVYKPSAAESSALRGMASSKVSVAARRVQQGRPAAAAANCALLICLGSETCHIEPDPATFAGYAQLIPQLDRNVVDLVLDPTLQLRPHGFLYQAVIHQHVLLACQEIDA